MMIRGPPGSGKTFLARKILEKEARSGNNRYKFLSIHKYSRQSFQREKVEEYQESLLKEMRRVVRENICNFIVLELEGCSKTWFHKFLHVAITFGSFRNYIIEMAQPREVCLKYNRNNRSFNDIVQAIKDMEDFEVPPKMMMLDPTFLLDPSMRDKVKASNTLDLATNLANLLQDKNVMQLLQSQLSQPPMPPQNQQQQQQQNQQQPMHNQQQQPMHNQQQNQQQSMQNFRHNQQQNDFNDFNTAPPPFNKENFNSNSFNQQREPQFDECPIFAPKKIIDYKHCHMPSFEEQLMEFRVFRVIDYKHNSTYQLREFVKDIDVDKIIEKRKSVALRKKILEYLKSAERPEDTVSNPKYPRNWEEISPLSRPPLKNKRKKKITAKIRRILAGQSQNFVAKSLMMGYRELGELEEISSEEEMDTHESPKAAPMVVEPKKKIPLEVVVDPLEKIPKTIPDFNHFRHSNTRNIRDFLWLPGRATRPAKILIILRGAPGSGKSHLTSLIKRKETEMRGDLKIISINRYFEVDNEDDDEEPSTAAQMTEVYLQQMVKMLKKPETTNLYNFIIIDAENCDLSYYNQFYQAGAAMGFATFTIELYQSFDICMQQNVNKKSVTEIRKEMAKLESNRIPAGHTLLIATDLYVEFNCLVNPKIKSEEDEPMDDDCCIVQEKMAPEITRVVYEEVPKLKGVPNFNWHGHEKFIDLREILEEPGRSSRPPKIMVILRAASGAGKTHLSGLIRNKEVAMGNGQGFCTLSIDDYFISKTTHQFQYNQNEAEEKLTAMMKNLKEEMRKEARNFIVVDAENGLIDDYMQVHEIGTRGGYSCYTIELYQEKELCMKNNVHNRTLKDIENVIEEIELNPIPEDHTLVNPSYLYVTSPRPLKSALKTSLTDSKVSIEKEFLSRLKQPLIVRGEIVTKNANPPGKLPEFNWHNREITDIRELLEEPGRSKRPEKIMIVLRGVPGSGKTFLAWLIERKEIEMGNRAQFKLLSMDKYFEREEYSEKCGEICKVYEFDASKLEIYMGEVVKEVKEVTQKAEQKFIIVDADCCDLKFYNQIFDVAQANGYVGYAIELNPDLEICLKFNDHQRDPNEIAEKLKLMENVQTPAAHTLLDPEYLYEEFTYEMTHDDDKMEVEEIGSEDEFGDEDEVAEASFGPLKKSAATTSKWDDDADAPDVMIERLDGTKNKTFERLTMADYLQTEDEWTMRPSQSGKKRVRWADIEEKKNQERMREIGFIVGQTDWKRMTDTSDGKSALEKMKFIPSRNK